MRVMIALILAAVFQTVPTFTLTVQGGTGSGTYACGTQVSIEAPASVPTYVTIDGKTSKVKKNLVFDKWGGDAAAELLARKTKLTMPCRDVAIHARYKAP